MITGNPVVEKIGRKIRLGIIGGAPGSFIGNVHRMAARLDDCYELLCGVMSSNPDKAVESGNNLGFASDRLYSDVQTMLDSEKNREDGIDAVAIMTPNHMHYPYAMSALKAGYHVICDKPMTNTLEQALELHRTAEQSGKKFLLTHNYTGYPLVRQAREMVRQGMLGDLRLVQVEYVQGGRSQEVEITPTMRKAWKWHPETVGPSLVMGDIGTHAHNILRYVTGDEVAQVSATLGAIVPNRPVHDFAGVQLKMNSGAMGTMWVTQAAAGVENSLKFRISGQLGTLEWFQEIPQRLTFFKHDGVTQVFTPNCAGSLPLAERASRIVKGHPEGFSSAFALLYRDFAENISAAILGENADPLSTEYPTSLDGLRGVQFIDACLKSSDNGSCWTDVQSQQ